MRLLARLLEPKATAYAHCDLPCGVYDPAQARIEAESVKAICQKYQDNSDPEFRAGQASPVGAVDRLLQAPALREVPAAPRAVQRGHQACGRGRHQGPRGRRHGGPASRQDRRDCQDLLGDQAGLTTPSAQGRRPRGNRAASGIVAGVCGHSWRTSSQATEVTGVPGITGVGRGGASSVPAVGGRLQTRADGHPSPGREAAASGGQK